MKAYCVVAWLVSTGVVACSYRNNAVQCEQNAHCNLNSGGACVATATGSQWCAYPDPECSSGYRYSDLDTGDGLSGMCTDENPDKEPDTKDAGTDGSLGDIVRNYQPATLVLGQSTFTGDEPNHGGISARSLSVAESVATGGDGSLWVLDRGNYRALQWSSAPQMNFAPASRVLGQPNFDSNSPTTAASGSITNFLGGLAAHDSILVVADGSRHRALIWTVRPSSNNGPANIVLGQSDFTSTTPGSGAADLNIPSNAWTDGTRLAITDEGNHRVLIWTSFPTRNRQPADIVLGQTTFGQSSAVDPPTSSSMARPRGVHFDGSRFYVADMNNHRVLIWASFPRTNNQPADYVLGQPGFSSRNAGIGSTGMSRPTGIATGGASLFVVDSGNSRVLVYSPVPEVSTAPASFVLGQPDFLRNIEGVSQADMRFPVQATTLGNALYVTDAFNSRVLRFDLNL